jgi:hypothetical protein
MDGLGDFIVRAKAATYVGDGQQAVPSRNGSHDLCFEDGLWQYRDSYFGGTDFIGQEVVWHCDTPRWAMNYYGRILRNDLIDGARAAQVIRAALTALYAEGRFLGGFQFRHDGFDYTDDTRGDVGSFSGIETIIVRDTCAYQLDYHGGLIRA